MPRAKGFSGRPKKKVVKETAEPAAEEPLTTGNFDGAREHGASSMVIMQEEVVVREPPPSPHAEERAAAQALHEEAIRKAAMINIIEQKFKEKEKVALRLCDAKERRMEDAKKPNRKKSENTMWNKAFRRLDNSNDRLLAMYNSTRRRSCP